MFFSGPQNFSFELLAEANQPSLQTYLTESASSNTFFFFCKLQRAEVPKLISQVIIHCKPKT